MGVQRVQVLVCVFAVTVVMLTAGVVTAFPATAQRLSDGCTRANNPALDSQYSFGFPPGPFAAGERLVASAGNPTSFGPPTTVSLNVDGIVVDSTSFPGTVSYTFPASASSVTWSVNSGNATWVLSCGLDPHAHHGRPPRHH